MKHKFDNFILVKHPLIKRDITILRDKKTNTESFRNAVTRISNIIAVEISKGFVLSEKKIKTPLEKTSGHQLVNEIVLLPVLRAGLGMVDGFLQIIPEAKVGHIGLERDEITLKPNNYYYKTPRNIHKAEVMLLDPMLATGGSASSAIDYLKRQKVKELVFACVIAAPEGVKKLRIDHPDVKIFGAALDRELNKKGYILPGLGDAGDRTFGTL